MFSKILRGLGWLAATLALLALLAYAWYRSLGIDQIPPPNKAATVADLDFMRQPPPATRGKVLAVVSSARSMDGGRKKAGYELTELARAYYLFKANGFEVDIASPAGGEPLKRIDPDDMSDADFAFLNDPEAQARASATLRLADVDPARYAAVYVVGGKGAMIDLPTDPDLGRIVSAIAERGVVGAVCHGPAALLGVKRADGRPLVAGRRLTGFSNAEENFVLKDARSIFPFLLEERARELGARFVAGPMFLDHTVVDGRLVTGQNSWSTWSTVDAMVKAMGYQPIERAPTGQELSVRVLAAYQNGGMAAARREQEVLPHFDKMLVLMHAVVAAMEWRLVDAFNLQRLANR